MVADAPRTHRITVAEYDRMIEAGVFAPDARLELLDGIIVEMSPKSDPHVWAVQELRDTLRDMFRDRATVFSESPVRLPTDGKPEPDVVMFRFDQPERRLPQPKDVLLLIEVSDSSLTDDRTRKLSLYARDGISEYWIRNLLDDTLEVYRDPDGDRYATSFTVRDRVPQACRAFPNDPISWW